MFENWGTILIFVNLLGNIPLHISSCYLGQLAYWKNLSGLVYITWSPYLYKCGTGKNFVIHSPLIKDNKVKHVFLGKQNLLKSLSFFFMFALQYIMFHHLFVKRSAKTESFTMSHENSTFNFSLNIFHVNSSISSYHDIFCHYFFNPPTNPYSNPKLFCSLYLKTKSPM